MDSIIKVSGLRFKYGRDYVLRDVSFSIVPGEVTAILGANGSGKTTLIKLILGLLRAEGGSIHVNNREINDYSPRKLARKIAYVPQAHTSVFPYTVREIIMMGREAGMGCFSRCSKHDTGHVERAIATLGIGGLSERIYSELSGGERQLVLIARALAQNTQVIVMDEPVSGLDFGNQARLLETVRELANNGLAILKSTHFPEHALMCADRAVILHRGRLLADGSPRDTINTSNMKSIYNIDIELANLPDGSLSCRPKLNFNTARFNSSILT